MAKAPLSSYRGGLKVCFRLVDQLIVPGKRVRSINEKRIVQGKVQ